MQLKKIGGEFSVCRIETAADINFNTDFVSREKRMRNFP